MKIISLILGMLLTSIIVNAQAPNIEWQKTYGGTNREWAFSIQQTSNDNYIVAGCTQSFDGDITENKGVADVWIIKLNNTGNTIWQKTYGGSDYDYASSIQETTDGEYIITGYTKSNNGDITENKGGKDVWIIKLDNTGNIIWQKTYGGSYDDYAESIIETADSGYIVAGYTESNNGDITENKGGRDAWIIKLDNTGNITWQKTYGGSEDDEAKSIQETTDGGYIIAGYTKSNNGDITENKGGYDVWIIKLDNTGNITWQKTYGGSENDNASSIQETNDGGYIVTSNTQSYNGDIIENKGWDDVWIIKLNNNGDITWQKTYGGSSWEYARSIIEPTDGEYIIAGCTSSNDGNITENKGGYDVWLIKINNVGNIIWQKTYGGSYSEEIYSLQKTTDDGYIVTGYSDSSDGDITENKGNNDFLILKLLTDTSNYIKQITDNNFSIYPNPTNGKVQISLNEQQIGNTLQVVNINSEVVKQLVINNEQLTIDLSNNAKGVYFVKLISESGVSTQKVVLE